MIRILFICHGNICRSPMGEFILKDLVEKKGLSGNFQIDSAATSSEEILNGVGNPIYPPARKKLAEHGIGCEGHAARQMSRDDYEKYDIIIGMDDANIRNILRMCGGDPDGKVHRMMEYTDRPGEVADPWYTGNFDAAYKDISEGCTGLLNRLKDID